MPITIRQNDLPTFFNVFNDMFELWVMILHKKISFIIEYDSFDLFRENGYLNNNFTTCYMNNKFSNLQWSNKLALMNKLFVILPLSFLEVLSRTLCFLNGRFCIFSSVRKCFMFKIMRTNALLHYLKLSIHTYLYIFRLHEFCSEFSQNSDTNSFTKFWKFEIDFWLDLIGWCIWSICNTYIFWHKKCQLRTLIYI